MRRTPRVREEAACKVAKELVPGHMLEVTPLGGNADGYRWFGECHHPGVEYDRCFTFAPSHDADTILRDWCRHIEEHSPLPADDDRHGDDTNMQGGE